MSKTAKPKAAKTSKAARAPAPFNAASFLETNAKGRVLARHSKKEIIFEQGHVADSVFYIKSGKVKVTVLSKGGKEAVVAILGAAEFLGEGCLIGQPKRLATAEAMTDCVTMRIDKAEIARTLREEPVFSEMFVAHILTRNARVEEDLVDQLFNSTERRLARVLLLLANFGKAGKPEPIIAKISQGDSCRNDRHDALSRQSFHEQVSQAWVHRLQRTSGNTQFAVKHCAGRPAAQCGPQIHWCLTPPVFRAGECDAHNCRIQRTAVPRII